MIVWNRDIAFYKIDVVKCTPVEGTGNVQTGGRELSVDEYLRRLDKAEEMYESFRKSGIILASYVLLLKEFENDETVVYKFGPNENVMGRIELNKLTRKFSELEGIPNPSIPSKFYFDRAAQRLAVCLVREGGEFPERTAFES